MAITHLRNIENFLKKRKNKAFTRTKIRNDFGMNYNIVLEVLDYLLEHKIIVRIRKKGQADKYKWK